jgi:hypothetical protein
MAIFSVEIADADVDRVINAVSAMFLLIIQNPSMYLLIRWLGSFYPTTLRSTN